MRLRQCVGGALGYQCLGSGFLYLHLAHFVQRLDRQLRVVSAVFNTHHMVTGLARTTLCVTSNASAGWAFISRAKPALASGSLTASAARSCGLLLGRLALWAKPLSRWVILGCTSTAQTTPPRLLRPTNGAMQQPWPTPTPATTMSGSMPSAKRSSSSPHFCGSPSLRSR